MLSQLEVQRIKWLFIEKMVREQGHLLQFKNAFNPVRNQARMDAQAGKPSSVTRSHHLAMWHEINRELEATVDASPSDLRTASLHLAQAETLDEMLLCCVSNEEFVNIKLPHLARSVGLLFALTKLRPHPPEFGVWNLQLVSALELNFCYGLLGIGTATGSARWFAGVKETQAWSGSDMAGERHPTLDWLESWQWHLAPLAKRWEHLLKSRGPQRMFDGPTVVKIAFACHAFWCGLEKTIEAAIGGSDSVGERDVLGYLDFAADTVREGFELAEFLAPFAADPSQEVTGHGFEAGPFELLRLFSKGYSVWWRSAFEAIAKGQYDVAIAMMSRLVPSAQLIELIDDLESCGYVAQGRYGE